MSAALAARVEGAFYAVDGSTGSRALDGLLGVAAGGYGLVVRLRNRAYDRGWLPARRAARPTLCVGNLTAGGSGKTPVVEHLARELLARRRAVAVLSRGFGGAGEHGGSCIVDAPDPARFGDEPSMLAERLPGAMVVVGGDRVASADLATRCGAELLLLDDGFQHRRLARDLDVLVVDGARGFGNGHLLPRGPLREPVSGLRRASLVLVRVGGDPTWERMIVSGVRDLALDVPVRRFRVEPTALLDGEGGHEEPAALSGRRVLAVSGIASPERFHHALDRLGARRAGELAFADHHAYDAADAGVIRERADAARAERIVTTEKDARKLGAVLDDERLRVLTVEARMEGGFDLASWALDRLPATSR